MIKKGKKNSRRSAARTRAKKSIASQNSSMEDSANTPPRGAESDPVPSTEERLRPACPDPGQGYQQLTHYLVERILKEVMRKMERLAHERHIPLDQKYWEHITRTILERSSTEAALVIPAPAGSGKSTWILAFLLALKGLFQSEPELRDSLVGVTVILQKVEDLNNLAEALNEGCPDGKRFMVPLQGWNPSGQRRGFCLDPSVDNYAGCLHNRCLYADRCRLHAFQEEAQYAPVVGMTQERFNMLRQGDAFSAALECLGEDGVRRPRRFVIFDEKFQMAPATALSTAQINEASTQFTELIRKFDTSDTHVRSLQQRLNYAVMRPFQAFRKRLCAEKGEGICDIPVGFLKLTEEDMETAKEYYEFRDIVLQDGKRLLNKSLSAIFSVMDALYEGKTCLFTKINGFCIYRHDPPQLHFGACQTLIFDATAEVDRDYCRLPNVEMLPGAPEACERSVAFHLRTHRDLNVSKSAMKKPWKMPAFTEYIASLVQRADKPIFLCTYKDHAVDLADRLKERLDPADFSKILLMPDRDEPTIPYFNGTNGSNAFKEAEVVIILGYPRLDPATYLSFACAACGQETLAAELEAIPKDKLLDGNFNTLELPSVWDYMAHHLAARLEQEIYRCAQRNPGFTGEINIHLFCPPTGYAGYPAGPYSGGIYQ